MTDINDLYEPGDDREPECDVEHQEPVSLGEVAELLQKAENAFSRAEQEVAERELIEVSVPQMIDEIGDLRLRIAEFEALPTREEWVVTGGPNFPAEPSGPPVSPDKGVLAYVNRHETARLWRRKLSVHPYEPIADESPF